MDTRYCPECWSQLHKCDMSSGGLLDYECRMCDEIFDIEATLSAEELIDEQANVPAVHVPTRAEELEKLERWNTAARSWAKA